MRRFNATDPRFLARIGWFYSNKIGRSDEHVQYRRLFKKLQEEKGEKHTDNWLVGYDWYVEAQKLVESGKPLAGVSGRSIGSQNQARRTGAQPAVVSFRAADGVDLLRRHLGRGRHIRRNRQGGMGKRRP